MWIQIWYDWRVARNAKRPLKSHRYPSSSASAAWRDRNLLNKRVKSNSLSKISKVQVHSGKTAICLCLHEGKLLCHPQILVGVREGRDQLSGTMASLNSFHRVQVSFLGLGPKGHLRQAARWPPCRNFFAETSSRQVLVNLAPNANMSVAIK